MSPASRKKSFQEEDEDFRIGSVVADGMWYNLPKWKKLAQASDEGMERWIKEHLADGSLVQATTGARSYRFPLTSVEAWHEEHQVPLGTRLIEGFYPPRIWDGMTETEGFLATPRRELAIVSFSCSAHVAALITERLRGIARVREIEPNSYKAYCLHADYAKTIIKTTFQESLESDTKRIYSRAINYRRELVDLTPEFCHHLIDFYKKFAKTLTKRSRDTISIFIPDPDDQDHQLVVWVCEAVEKFNEAKATPFSGYLDEVLRHWPYNLPNAHLGQELSNFQRDRSLAVKALKKAYPEREEFTMQELAQQMGRSLDEFIALEERHKVWLAMHSSTNLTWEENNEEKMGRDFMATPDGGRKAASNPELAHRLSIATLKAALETESYEDAYLLIAQMDNGELDAKVKDVSPLFIKRLGEQLGL